MIGSLVSLMIAMFLLFNPNIKGEFPYMELLSLIFLIMTIVLFLIYGFSFFFSWIPLQKAEQNLTSRIVEIYRKDTQFWYIRSWMILFILISAFFAMDTIFFGLLRKNALMASWILLVGISLDLIFYRFSRILNYLNPFSVVHLFAQKAKKSIQDDHHVDLCDWIDALCEISIKAIQRNGVALSLQSIDALQVTAHLFLESAKSIGHSEQLEKSEGQGSTDRVSYTLFYLLQRLDLINQKALEKRLETICTTLITAVGKIVIYAAKYDLTMTTYPLFFLNKLAKAAQDERLPDVGVKASLTLVEISKMIIHEIDVQYADLKDLFLRIIGHLEEITKNSFRQDKNQNIKILLQPFYAIKDLFTDPKVSNHQDTPIILQDIERVIVEFETLETVLRTMPPIPNIVEEEKK